MRVLAATLVFVAALIQLLIGSTYVLGSGYKTLKPDHVVEQSGASLVPKQLGDQSSPIPRRLSAEGGARSTLLGIGTLVAALLGLATGFLLLVRARARARGTTLALTGIGLCAAWVLATILADGVAAVSAVSLCLLVLAMGAALLTRARPKTPTESGTESDAFGA